MQYQNKIFSDFIWIFTYSLWWLWPWL